MELTKRNVTIRGDWEDGIYSGVLESGSELNGFWVNTKFKAESKDGYIHEIQINKWQSGFVDKDNNECSLSDSMDDLLESKVKFYIKNAVL